MSLTWGRALARVVSLLALGLITASTHAADTWYMVELIVFAQNKPDTGSEHWPADRVALLPSLADATLIPGKTDVVAADAKIKALPVEQYRLQGELQRLRENENYTILLHTGWRQPGLAREEAIAVRLRSDPPLPEATTSAGTEAQLMTPLVLDGTVRLILSRYLHLETDLLYRPEANAPASSHSIFASDTPTEPTVYQLHETRRMRSKEVHYLDHPLFGVIALVTPYEVATPAAPAPTPAIRRQ